MSAPPTVARARPPSRAGAAPVRRTRWLTLAEVRWAGVSTALFLGGSAVRLWGAPAWSWWALYLGCYAAGGWEPGLAGIRAARERTLDVDLLMVVAALGALAVGQVTDGALLIVIFATSGALEALATARTEDSVRGLVDLTPRTATRLEPGGGEETVVATELRVGDVVLIRPGEWIAADAVVVGGAGEVDQATVTGEPLPVDKTVGDELFAGTLNGTGSLRARVVRRAGDSVVARIAALVERASRTKAATQLFIEKVEQRYSVGMVAATTGVFVIPLLIGRPVRESLLRAMTFMIVASPCAVVLATMPPLLAAIANAGRHGVLARSAVVMERLGTITQVAVDKTGTLTRGTPVVAAVRVLLGTGLDEATLLRLAAGAERPSEHPLGAAIVRAARSRGLELPEAREFSAVPGRGVTARVEGTLVQVGSPAALLAGTGDPAADPVAGAVTDPVADTFGGVVDPTAVEDTVEDTVEDAVAGLRRSGHTAVVVVREHRPVGVLGLTDQPRPEAAATVARLARQTGVPPVLLTGDDPTTAGRLAGQVGIGTGEVRAGLLPEAKLAAVAELQADGQRVMMVGDGINDAPALAAAHVGVAMGGAGSDLALRTADAVIVRDDLSTLPTVLALSRRARRVVVANLALAAGCIAVLVVWDLAGNLPLALGVAGHEGSTVIVGLNGLRLLRSAAWRRAAR